MIAATLALAAILAVVPQQPPSPQPVTQTVVQSPKVEPSGGVRERPPDNSTVIVPSAKVKTQILAGAISPPPQATAKILPGAFTPNHKNGGKKVTKKSDTTTTAVGTQGAQTHTAGTSRGDSETATDAPEKTTNTMSGLDGKDFGTGDETGSSETGKAAKADESEDRSNPELAFVRVHWGAATAILDLLLIALIIVALILLKRDTHKTLGQLKTSLEQLNKEFVAPTRRDMPILGKRIDDLYSRVVAIEASDDAVDLFKLKHEAPPVASFFVETPTARKFPVLVSDYVAQQMARSLRVKATSLDGDLFARDQNGEFWLVSDTDGSLYVVPAHENITTAVFKTYYRNSYDCSLHGSGDLYLVSPAEVRARGDLWHLMRKGKLEVRMP